MPDYVFEWYHQTLFDALQKVETGEIKKLMVFMHPRLGKSEIVSKRLPSWFLGRNPKKRVLCCSNKSDLASRFGRQARSVCLQPSHKNVFERFKLADEKREAGDWETDEGGGYLSAGVGSAIVGAGFELGIIDDPVKTREEVESPERREKLMEWYRTEFLTRRNPADYRIILMHQRWHEEDLAGMLLEEEGEEWTVINFPAISEEGKPLSTERGFGLDFYNQARKEMGERNFASMYQQDPIKASGSIFKKENFRHFALSDLKPEDFTIGIHCDPAWSTRERSDDTAICVTARHKQTKEIYILDIYGSPILPSEAYKYILSTASKWHSRGWTIDFVSVEDVEISKDQQTFVAGLEEAMKHSGEFYTLLTMKPRGKGKKEERIQYSLEPVTDRKALYFREDDSANEAWRRLDNQFIRFPFSTKDDLIDSVSQGVIMWQERIGVDEDEKDREKAAKIDKQMLEDEPEWA